MFYVVLIHLISLITSEWLFSEPTHHCYCCGVLQPLLFLHRAVVLRSPPQTTSCLLQHKRKHLKQQPQVRQSEKSFSLCFANTDRPKGVQKDGCLVPHKHTHFHTVVLCVVFGERIRVVDWWSQHAPLNPLWTRTMDPCVCVSERAEKWFAPVANSHFKLFACSATQVGPKSRFRGCLSI